MFWKTFQIRILCRRKKNHIDIITSGEELNIQDIPLSSQESTFDLKEEYHVVEEHVDCEITPSVKPIPSQLVTHALKEKELPFRESLF